MQPPRYGSQLAVPRSFTVYAPIRVRTTVKPVKCWPTIQFVISARASKAIFTALPEKEVAPLTAHSDVCTCEAEHGVVVRTAFEAIRAAISLKNVGPLAAVQQVIQSPSRQKIVRSLPENAVDSVATHSSVEPVTSTNSISAPAPKDVIISTPGDHHILRRSSSYDLPR